MPKSHQNIRHPKNSASLFAEPLIVPGRRDQRQADIFSNSPATEPALWPAQAKALIYEWEDGAVEVHYRGERIDYEDRVERPTVVAAAPAGPRREPAKHGGSKPAPDHPWREGYEQRMKLQKLDGRQMSALEVRKGTFL